MRECLVSNKNHFQVLVLWTDTSNYPDADGDFSKAPYFNFNDDKVKFDTKWLSNANENYGSASAFLPKSLFISEGHSLQDAFCIISSYSMI